MSSPRHGWGGPCWGVDAQKPPSTVTLAGRHKGLVRDCTSGCDHRRPMGPPAILLASQPSHCDFPERESLSRCRRHHELPKTCQRRIARDAAQGGFRWLIGSVGERHRFCCCSKNRKQKTVRSARIAATPSVTVGYKRGIVSSVLMPSLEIQGHQNHLTSSPPSQPSHL